MEIPWYGKLTKLRWNERTNQMEYCFYLRFPCEMGPSKDTM